jgi:LysR family transcriptional regulator for metE and metH
MVAAIAESGGVTRAAAELHLTQSAISHQLRGIEDRLGTPLFSRVGKRMVATPAGQRVLLTARRVLEDVGHAEEDVRRIASGAAGSLRVCAQCNTGYHWLPRLLDAYRRRHPLVDVSLAVECTTQPLEALLDGRLDLAILTGTPCSPHVRIRPLFEDEHALIVAPEHRLARRSYVRPEELADERVLLYSSSPDDSFTVREILRPAGVPLDRVSFVMLTEAILEMVKARIGVSVMQTWAVEPALRAGEIRAIRITPAGIRRAWSAATLVSAGSLPHVEDFIELLATRALPGRHGRPAAARRPATASRTSRGTA